MIEASSTRLSTSSAVIAATAATSKPRNACRNACRFPNTIDQLSPASKTPRVRASNSGDSSYVRVPHTSSWYRPSAVSPAPAQTQRAFPSYPMTTSLLIEDASPARLSAFGECRPGGGGDVGAGVRMPGDTPPALGRFGDEHPRSIRVAGIAGRGGDDL